MKKKKNLSNLKLVDSKYGYCTIDDVPAENIKNGEDAIPTLIEATIGALYLEEFEKSGVSIKVREFIEKNVLK